MVFKRIAGPWRREPGKRQRRGSWTNVRHCSWTAFLFPSVFSQKVTGGSVLLKLGLWNIGSALLPWQPLSAPNSFSFLKIKCSFSKYLPPPAPSPASFLFKSHFLLRALLPLPLDLVLPFFCSSRATHRTHYGLPCRRSLSVKLDDQWKRQAEGCGAAPEISQKG